jgi:hypothetical protein
MKAAWKLAFMATATALVSLDARANLLLDPGFESGSLASWAQWQPTNSTLNAWGRDGSDFSVAGWWQTSGWQDAAISNPNQSYTVGGWIYDDVANNESLRNGAFATIRVEFKDASDVVIGTWSTPQITGAMLADNTWSEFTAQVMPSSYGPGITKATLVWEVNNIGTGDGRGIFDDLIIEPNPIPESGGFLVMGLGLFGIAVAVHRARVRADRKGESET